MFYLLLIILFLDLRMSTVYTYLYRYTVIAFASLSFYLSCAIITDNYNIIIIRSNRLFDSKVRL